jgi:hypothetical protein
MRPYKPLSLGPHRGKIDTYSWTLVLSPGKVDQDWLRYQRRQMFKALFKGFYVGVLGAGAVVALISWVWK